MSIYAHFFDQKGRYFICRGRGYGGGGYSGGYYYRSPMIWWDASDLLWFQSRRTPQKNRNSPMSFLESVFSFVFGDGDPNRDFEEKLWQMVSFQDYHA